MGYKGGQAGSGGQGGNAGNSGQIVVRWVDGSVPSAIAVEGAIGRVGDHGKRGDGGDGGPPGNPNYKRRWHPACTPRREYCDDDDDRDKVYSPALHGPKGLDGDPAENTNKDGSPGTVTPPNLLKCAIDDLAPEYSIAQLQMILSQCEIDFTNQNLTLLRPRLEWLAAVGKAPHCGELYEEKRAIRLRGTPPKPQPEEWKALGLKATVLLHRLHIGLDAYGYAPNYVSPLNPDALEKYISRALDLAETIENAHANYLAHLTENTVQQDQLNIVFNQTSERIFLLDQTLSKEKQNDINALQTEISHLSESIEKLQGELTAADQAFQADVKAATGGCNIVAAVQFIGGVIAIANGAASGFAAVASSLNTIATDSTDHDLITTVRFVNETFDKNKVNDHLNKIKEGYKSIKEAKEEWEKGQAKIVVSLETFEEQLQPYLSKMDSAVRYRDTLRRFVDISQTRNHKQFIYTQLVLDQKFAKAQKSSLLLESNRIQNLLTLTNNPALKECVAYLSKSLRQAKDSVIELMELQRRSLVYTTLSPIPLSYRRTKVVDLRTTQNSYHKLWIEAEMARNGTELILPATFEITRKNSGSFFTQLSSKGTANFSIPLNHPSFNDGDAAFVTAQEVQITLADLKVKRTEFACRLTHSGYSVLKDFSGQLWSFVHKPRPTILKYRLKEGKWQAEPTDNNMRGSLDKYNYYSPFTVWTLSLYKGDKVDATDFDLSKVKAIRFEFKIRVLPRNSTPLRSISEKLSVV